MNYYFLLSLFYSSFFFFFFFQAEDGIRDHCVTGVQSALPISVDERQGALLDDRLGDGDSRTPWARGVGHRRRRRREARDQRERALPIYLHERVRALESEPTDGDLLRPHDIHASGAEPAEGEQRPSAF